MKRVLIIGPNFHYFNASIQRAFSSLGWDTRVDAYDTPINPYTILSKIRYKISADKNKLKLISRRKYDKHIHTIMEEFHPQLVFILNGDNLLPQTTKYISERAKIAIWLFDSVQKYPVMLENLRYANSVFCYEQDDIPFLKNSLNIDAFFLPQAYDPQLYYPIHVQEKKYDIAFAGDIWQSEKRQQILKKVVEHFSDKRIIIWGIYKPWYKGIVKWLTRERKDIYKNQNTTAEVLNRTYNEAKLVLNIHVEQQRNGANPKVYEIAATGATQLCDRNPFIEHLFTPQENISFYSTTEELISLIENHLSHPTPQRSYNNISQHTFTQRIKYVLSKLEL